MVSRKKGKKKGTDGHISGTAGLKLIQHKHCQVCGKAQLLEEEVVCSDECKKTLDDNIRRKKMWWVYIFLLVAVFVTIFIVMPLLT